MIKIFSKIDNIFTSNGDKILNPLKSKVRKVDNGDFYFEFECGIEYSDYIIKDNIIVVPTPTGEQAFRINKINKNRLRIKGKALHVFYDSKRYLIEDSYVVNKNCNDALDHLNAATDNFSPFKTLSDIGSINSYRCVRKTLYEAIEVVRNRWGGHVVRDNFNIAIREKIGTETGVVIRYKKNLKEINCDEDWSGVVTKLLPVGKDGLLLDEKYIFSNIQYDLPYTKTESFDQNIERKDFISEEEYINALKKDLKNKAVEYVEKNKLPKVNYTISTVVDIDKIKDIGDVVEVIDERLGVKILTNIISYEFDPVLKKFTSLEFGNSKNTLSNLVENVSKITDEKIEKNNSTMQIKFSDDLKNATDKINNVLGSSYIINEGHQLLIVDKLPKEDATYVMRINSRGIGFSNTGINGTFNSAWLIDGTLDMQNINVINLVADLIKGGTLKLGSNFNDYGKLEIYDEANKLIGEFNKNGLKMYGCDESYVLLNNEVGFAGFDKNDNKIYWVDKDEFHQKKSVVEEEITLCNKLRFIPITIYDNDNDNNIINDGIGLVSVYEGGQNG